MLFLHSPRGSARPAPHSSLPLRPRACSLQRTIGFSLTELLVAMAIFATLMSGLAILFSTTTATVRQSNNAMEAYDKARGIMSVIDRDLKKAFVSRELGQYFSFYGRPEGFMFVGANENGQLSRVTYVLHPNADTKEWRGVLAESYQNVLQRVQNQARRIAIERQNRDPDVAARVASDTLAAAYLDRDPPDEFDVLVRTYSLVRYEETGASDLDTFQMAVDVNGTQPVIPQWPFFDSIDHTGDSDSAPPIEGPYTRMYDEFIADAIRPNGTDIRLALFNASSGGYLGDSGVYYYPRVVNARFVQLLLTAKKRELWIRMVGGDGSLPAFWTSDQKLDELAANNALTESTQDYWLQQTGHNVNDYVVSEDILRQAVLLNPETGRPLVYDGVPLDAYNVSGIFRYGNAEGNHSTYFNALENITGLMQSRWNGDQYTNEFDNPGYRFRDGLPAQELLKWDYEMAEYLRSKRTSAATLGSPLLPQLPALVVPGFYITTEASAPGDSDFRHWFSQAIDIPTGFTRDLPPSITENPGYQ